jgi:type IV pilus assembly protein PilW
MTIRIIRKRQRGLGMIELMIALVITLLLGMAVGGVFVVAKRGFADAEDFARIQDNGRYALFNLVRDLQLVGFWGDIFAGDIVDDPNLDSVSTDCSNAAAALDTSFTLFSLRLGSTSDAVSCIDDAAGNSDVLVVKHVEGLPIDAGATLDANRTYMMTNLVTGRLFNGDDTPPTTTVGGDVPGGRIWAYEVYVYYVRQSGTDKRLYRKTLQRNGTSWEMVSEEVAAGVEAMRFMFGVDSNGDGTTDRYVNAGSLSSVADWGTVLTVQVYLLVRGIEDKTHTDSRTYTMGDVTAGPFNDNYHRSLMTSTVNLRNPVLLSRGNW